MKKHFHFLREKLTKLLSSKEFWFFFILALIFLANTTHQSYPDEFDNISGGRFILKGVLPYKGFLSHHGPFAYYLAAVINIFSGVSFVRFRLVYALLLVGMLYLFYRLIKDRFAKTSFFLKPYFLTIGFMGTYFWLHMMLADSMSALMLILPYFYLVLLAIKNKKLEFKDLWIVSIPLAATLLTALTYSFLVAGFYFFLAILWLRSGYKLISKDTLKAIGIVAAPYLLFVAYLFVTGSFRDYYFQNITYNSQYYIFNYPRAEGQTSVNPVRYAVVIAKTALDHVADGAKHVFRFNLYTPKEIPLLGMNLLLLVYLGITGSYLAIIPLVIMLLFSTPRSNPMELAEIDYQAAVYIVLSLGNGMLLLYENLKNKVLETQKDFIRGFITVISGAFMLTFVFFMFQPFVDKMYKKYMGIEPLIYDRPEIAPALNQLLDKSDYAWVGPFDFENLYYLNTRFPSNYHWLLPANAQSEKIRTEMMADFEANKPKIIVFDRNFTAFGAAPSSFNYFMVDFINANYTLISEAQDEEGRTFKCEIPQLREFRCDEEWYLRNDVKDELLQKMLELNLASKAN